MKFKCVKQTYKIAQKSSILYKNSCSVKNWEASVWKQLSECNFPAREENIGMESVYNILYDILQINKMAA